MSKKKEIKYRLEYHPNQNVCEIHFNSRLISNQTWIVSSEHICSDEKDSLKNKGEEIALKLIDLLINIDGISSIFIKPFSVSLNKGEVFDWEDIISDALNTISYCIGTDSELKEKDPPIIHPVITPDEIARLDRTDDDTF